MLDQACDMEAGAGRNIAGPRFKSVSAVEALRPNLVVQVGLL
jgi:hypothetical protein